MLKITRSKKGKATGKAAKEPAGDSLGVSAGGNSVYRLTSLSLLAILFPTALAFAYLILFREPALQQRQIDEVAESIAVQQATNIQHMLSRLETRIESAAQSPLARSVLAAPDRNGVSLAEKALLDYFPEAVSLRIIPLGEMGTAVLEGGNQGLRNHIEVDLVRRASEGEVTRPEAYRVGKRWLTSMAQLVTDPGVPGGKAVILLTMDNDRLSEQLSSLDAGNGKFALEQVFGEIPGGRKVSVIAARGRGDATSFTRRVPIPGTNWRMAFTPSRALVTSLSPTRWPLGAALVLIAIAALAGTLMLTRLTGRKLASQVSRILAVADRATPLVLDFPELVAIARHIREAAQRAGREGTGLTQPAPAVAPRPGDELVNPMFQSARILDEVEEEVLELDPAPDHPEPRDAGMPEPDVPEHIFRAYDIRGNARTELSEDLVRRIGLAIGSLARESGEQTLIVGRDGRNSSPRISAALMQALTESGCDVIDIGLVPTPLLYYATRHLECRSGIMVTGSHNPVDDNGLKIVLNQQTIAAGGIWKIRERIQEGNFSSGSGRIVQEDVAPAYRKEVIDDIAVTMPLKIVVDAGNGAAGFLAPGLFEAMGCEVVPLYCEVDGNFPNHPPDTSDEDNLADLADTVRAEGADFGVAFDGDGDRLAVVTGSGRIVRSDKLLMIFARNVVSRNPGADVVFDVKCTRDLTRLITHYGGRPILWKTGHAFMKEKMRETGALLGGEFSGHIFFGERWYGFDDGIYAAGRLAEVLSTSGETLDQILDDFPTTFNTPEILIPVPEERKFALMDRIVRKADFPSGKVNTLDGIRVDYAEGWGLVRASNTNAALTARFEANSEQALETIKAEFRSRIAQADPKLDPGF